MAGDKVNVFGGVADKPKPKKPSEVKIIGGTEAAREKAKAVDKAKRASMARKVGIDNVKPPEAPKAPAKKKEAKEKKVDTLKFPSSLELPITRDQAALEEWHDTSPTPEQCLKSKFPNKCLTDVDGACARWVTRDYVNRVPVVKIKPEDLDKMIGKYFKVRELVKIDPNDKAYMVKAGTWKKHEKFMIRDANGQYYWGVARIDPNLCGVLDDIRKEAGFPLRVDEGVRPHAYNKDMYLARHPGKRVVTGSPHTSGRGVDLCRTGDKADDKKFRGAIRDALAGKGGGFGSGDSVYHVDIKIQTAKKGGRGNWIIKGDKVTLRLRTWEY